MSARGPRDRRGRSLYQLDLDRRLLKYPCSYLIYSPAFDALAAAGEGARSTGACGRCCRATAARAALPRVVARRSTGGRRDSARDHKPDLPRRLRRSRRCCASFAILGASAFRCSAGRYRLPPSSASCRPSASRLPRPSASPSACRPPRDRRHVARKHVALPRPVAVGDLLHLGQVVGAAGVALLDRQPRIAGPCALGARRREREVAAGVDHQRVRARRCARCGTASRSSSPSGTACSGRRMPPVSLPSASTCESRNGIAETGVSTSQR